jgi:hypothetical protein
MPNENNSASVRYRVVEDPTTPKQNAIVEAIIENPSASNAQIADAVEERLGEEERPSASWVSRIRSEKMVEVEDVLDGVTWEDVDYSRMRKVGSVRGLDVGRNPSKDDLTDALEADGLRPEVVASLPDGGDAEAIEATVDTIDGDHKPHEAAYDDEAQAATNQSGEAGEDPHDADTPDSETTNDRIDALAEAVEEVNERLRHIERVCERNLTDDEVAELLRERADELDGY